MRQSCRIVNDRVFGHVCGGDHGDAGRADASRGTPAAVRAAPPDTRRVCHRAPPCGMCPCEPVSGYRTPGAPREPFAPGGCGKSPGRRDGSEGREERADLGFRAGTRPDHTFRSRPRGAEPAVRRRVRPLKRSARPPPAPGGGSRPRAAAGPLSRLAPGHRGHGAWADLPTPRCRPRRTRRRGGAVGKLAGIRRYLPARPLAPMWKILWLPRVMSTTRVLVWPALQVRVTTASVRAAVVPLSVTFQARGTFWARRTPLACSCSSQAFSSFWKAGVR